jgi:hypothetical protein
VMSMAHDAAWPRPAFQVYASAFSLEVVVGVLGALFGCLASVPVAVAYEVALVAGIPVANLVHARGADRAWLHHTGRRFTLHAPAALGLRSAAFRRRPCRETFDGHRPGAPTAPMRRVAATGWCCAIRAGVHLFHGSAWVFLDKDVGTRRSSATWLPRGT